MTQIAKTRIATSAPLDLCKGFPIWPDLGALRLGMSSAGESGALIKSKHKLLWYRFGVEVSYQFFIGICGPAFAVGMDLEGSAAGNTITLSVHEDEVQAGMIAGFVFTAGADVTLEEYRIFKGWKNDLKLGAEITLDVLGLFIDAILWCMKKDGGGGEAEMKEFPNHKGYWSMLASNGGVLGTLANSVAEPKMHLPIDVVPDVPPLEAINASLHVLLGEFSMGPTLWFGIPVSVSISGLALDAVGYTGIKPDGHGRLTGTTTGTAPASPEKLKATLAHTAGFDFGTGFFAEISVLKLFSLSGHIDFSLLSLMGITPHGGSYSNTLENKIGEEALTDPRICHFNPAGLQVVLEPPA